MARMLAYRDFLAYRRWVLGRLASLLSGDDAFWDTFERTRSRFCAAPGSLTSRFSWEKPFLRRPAGQADPISRRDLCTGYGISGDRLRRYEQAGMFPGPPGPGPRVYGMKFVKRLQWVLFFHSELGLHVDCLSAFFSMEAVQSGFESLTASAPPHVPVHRSRPAPSPGRRKTVDLLERPTFPGPRSPREPLHDLGNNLHVISGRAERLRRKLPGNELVERNTSIILEQSKKAAAALGKLGNLIENDPTTPSHWKKGA